MRGPNESWRPVKLFTIARAERMGWAWLSDPRRGAGARALRSRSGTIYEVRMRPLAVRRYEDRRFADAA